MYMKDRPGMLLSARPVTGSLRLGDKATVDISPEYMGSGMTAESIPVQACEGEGDEKTSGFSGITGVGTDRHEPGRLHH